MSSTGDKDRFKGPSRPNLQTGAETRKPSPEMDSAYSYEARWLVRGLSRQVTLFFRFDERCW